MKQIVKKLSLVSLLFVIIGGGLSSCSKDDEKLKELTVNFQAETYPIEQGQTVEIPFTVGNVSGAEITGQISTDNAEYSATLSEIIKGEGTITVAAPQYIFTPATVTLTLTVNDEANKRTATGTVQVSSETDESYTEITQPANCYIAAPGAMVKFPANIGNTTDKAVFETAELLWQDAKGLVGTILAKPEEGAVVAILNPQIEGNALVAVKDAAGDIVWSYHLWITASDPRPEENPNVLYMYWTDTLTNIEYKFMDRYIGAISNQPGSDASNGLFYQWGRKDPFAASTYQNSIKTLFDIKGDTVYKTVTPCELENNIENSIKTPTTHYSGVSGGNYSWLTTTKALIQTDEIKDLWGGVSGTQTKYDPCPAGWRVAPVSAWKFYNDKTLTVTKVFTDNEEVNAKLQGRIFTANGGFWFPSQGEIQHSGNFVYGIGSTYPNGKAWTSSTDADNYRSWGTTNSPTTVSYYAGLTQGYALPVRCVKL